MDDMRAFFNLIDDFAIVVVDYNNGNIMKQDKKYLLI